MKFVFIVQGEGRGHMTQAISLFEMLDEMGHEVAAVCIGTSQRREIPDFVKEKLTCPLLLVESPNFVTDKNHKGVLLGKTIRKNLRNLPTFQRSLRKIHELVSKHQPDILLNFYDLLGGLYNARYRPSCRLWVIGHQYLSLHPDFPFPSGNILPKILFQLNTHITALGADEFFALSFRNLPKSKRSNLHVLPPLLRKSIFDLQPEKGDYILTYMVNSGYSEEVLHYAKNNPELKIEAFWDKMGMPERYCPLPNVVFHQVNDRLFLTKMAKCRGFVSTAGFESICEAMYLGKPVMMVPVKKHFEQTCNALDASLAGVGTIAKSFDFGAFDKHLRSDLSEAENHASWVSQFKSIFKGVLSNKTSTSGETTLGPNPINKAMFG
ncbi:hypothetical protein P872_25100 [Rhodonellum psychrophilum GCM71 = DSM 17998]|uniref:Glycosyltransferase n=2 Tax=Rhodonellum TaxID=336827 RepID=U5C677_9BACT|nr:MULTISPECIES: glycosyltransferase family protein [Rhodonellum]ERM84436.1 hypothetical protein P872_25100 [Rhodonellum psychrophilum GCM71 = DSM 17998]SDZ00087.1 conserved hypothetical protein [Rhodonellum ikkaensis]